MRRVLALCLFTCAGPLPDLDSESPGSEPGPEIDAARVDCSLGRLACPLRISSFPFTDRRSTLGQDRDRGSSLEAYACAPEIDESGPERVYRVDVPGPGLLTAHVVSGEGVDVDVHLLRAADASTCVSRGHRSAGWRVAPGVDGRASMWIVVDSFVDAGGVPLAGDYSLRVDWLGEGGTCGLDQVDQRMVWSTCAPNIDCERRGTDTYLHLPALGPVVEEAHLVTDDEGFEPGRWPASFGDRIAEHYARSAEETGAVLARDQGWAPAGEGGSEFGQAAVGAKLPVLDEAWYVNMYWHDRPAPGTRLLVLNPATGAAVVASGGYETGPGTPEAIGGAVEEIHLSLGTDHRSPLVMGYLRDQSLPLGPIDCGLRRVTMTAGVDGATVPGPEGPPQP